MNGDPSNRTESEPETEGAETEQSVNCRLDVHELGTLLSDAAGALFDPDGRIASWSDSAQTLTGYDEEVIVGSHYRTFFPADERKSDRPEQLLERARSDGTIEIEGWRVGSDGERLWVRECLAPICEDGTIGDDGVEDRDELQGYTWLVHNRTGSHERERELQREKAFAEHVFEAQPDIVYAFDADGNYLEWNDRVTAVTGYTESELAEMNPLDFVAPDHRDRIAATIRRVLEEDEYVTAEADLLTKDGHRIPYEFNSAQITDDDGTVLGFTGIGRDISERKARERELERLEELNAIVRTIDEAMVAAESREAIETAIVEEFAAADVYEFAVIGRTETVASTDHSWEPETWAGIDAATVDGVLSSFVDPPADAPGESPFETKTAQRYRNLRESDIDEWRADARERGYASVAAVPIVASDRPFGALVIAADEPSAFTDREQEILQEFGGTIGHAINAMAVRRLLYMDTVIELEFESTDRADVCIDLSARTDCDLSVDHVLPLTDETFVYYLTVSDIDPETVRDVTADDPAVTELRLIEAGDDESYWEVVVRGSTITDLLGEYGARLRSKEVREGVAELTVQVSPDVDLRELVSAVTSAYPETELVSKQTVDRPVETRGDFRRTVESMLTEKQRLALEAAYHGGYFEWPTRNSDASEIADRLGIARQTFHQHLRVAQAKLLSAYFDTTE